MAAPISWSRAGDDICICGIGVRSPLGFSAAASAAAVRGAISAVSIHPAFLDKVGEPINMARDADLDPDVDIAARMEAMLASAIADACADMLPARAWATTQCWIGLPELRPGLPSDLASLISSALERASPATPSAIKVLPRGHASGLMALQVAAQKIAAGEMELCIAAGVDSYHDVATLQWLDESGLVMSAENRNGFAPSEAAGACLVASRTVARRYGLPILARIVAATTAFEPKSIRSSEICIGEGLTVALQGVISSLRLPDQAITAMYCDLNGERYRNEEFVYTLLRVQEGFVDAHDYLSPADCWGDVGAASGPLFASLAVAASERGYAKGPYPVLWAGSESGHRTAVLLALGEP